MANGVMNIARGRIGYYAQDSLGLTGNGGLVIVVLSLVEVDDTLNNYDDLNTLLVAAGNAEANATGYGARKSHAAADVSGTPDDTNNRLYMIIDTDDTWTSVANDDSNGDWNKLLVTYDSDTTTGTDANIVPCTYHDFVVTPNGGDITANYDQTNGFYQSN